MSNENLKDEHIANVFIIPHTHWDREWYLPFQKFRFKLIHLIDELLEILQKQNYCFMLDGQTIVLEDYLEIRPEKKEQLMEFIRKGNIAVGPWYVLPDEWLVGQESIIRNLEFSIDLAQELMIPLMQIAYLPDQFGHTSAIPQIFSNLTSISQAIIWRGVGHYINTISFKWKKDQESFDEILTFYLPFGYGNAAQLPEEQIELEEALKQKVEKLKPLSPLPIYLLMNGEDHLFPQPNIQKLLPEIKLENTKLTLGLLNHFTDKYLEEMKNKNYKPPLYVGEFRSPLHAPLLQDTYSARMWIKQWDNKIEDLLVHYAEPINAYLWLFLEKDYPKAFVNQAWKWLLQNQPHDSICGCSVDQTHDEMKARYYWAESIAQSVIDESIKYIEKNKNEDKDSFLLVFNPSNNSEKNYIEFTLPINKTIQGLQDEHDNVYEIQPISASQEIVFENDMKPAALHLGLNLLSGRKLMNDYINEAFITESTNKDVCNITVVLGKEAIGKFDVNEMKRQAKEILDSKKYKYFHIKATRSSQQTYGAIVPLKPFAFTKLIIKEKIDATNEIGPALIINKNQIDNHFYTIKLNKNGSFNLFDKTLQINFSNLHKFEDWGDRGDEYTFGRLKPEYAKIRKVKRTISKGKLFCDIKQTIQLECFKEVNLKRTKRIMKGIIPVKTRFRVYRDINRIDIKTDLTNTVKDHRLRICFNLPFNSKETITSTHFGIIKRNSSPEKCENCIEMPSGIQAQKRFIRAETLNQESAFTLINRGLPEVELVNNSKFALTLIRSIGYLSRSDFPERPMHAGPFLETPKAQELGIDYTFDYSIISHLIKDGMDFSANQAEAFSLPPKCVYLENGLTKKELLKPILSINPIIRISSMRIRNGKLISTLYNLSSNNVMFESEITSNISNITQVKIDGTKIQDIPLENHQIKIIFKPNEIKILAFEK